MYEGFERDLRSAVDAGDEAVARLIRETAQRTGARPWDVFEASARLRHSWRHNQVEPAPRARRGRRRPSARKLVASLFRTRGRRRRNPIAQAGRAALSVAGRQVRAAGRRLAKAGARAARRQLRCVRQQLGRSARRHVARAGAFAFSLGHWLVKREWPTPRQLRQSPATPQRPPPPAPSPAVAAMLHDGYTFREATYLFPDPHIRDPHDDWPGALRDFHQAVRSYVGELRRYIEETP